MMMGREPALVCSRSGSDASALSASASRMSGLSLFSTSSWTKTVTSGPSSEAGPDRDHVRLEIENRLQRAGVHSALGRLVERQRHVLGAHRRDDRLRAFRSCEADQAGSRSQRSQSRKMRGACLASGSRDDQHVTVVAFVRIGFARLNDLAHRLTGQQVQTRPGEIVDHLRRDADVCDDDVARLRFAWRQHERKLRRRKRHGYRSADALADRLGMIGRQPARKIDRR